MENKYVYTVQTIWAVEGDNGVDTFIFSNYKKALRSFYSTIEDEKENTWVGDYYHNGEFDENVEYEHKNLNYLDNEEMPRSWYVVKRHDRTYHTFITLDIVEINQ